LMSDVFQRYGRERARGLSDALRQSQLDLIRDGATAHPYYWAAFTLIGDGDALGGSGVATIIPQANGGTL